MMIEQLARALARLRNVRHLSLISGYERISREQLDACGGLADAWKTPEIAAGQKAVVDIELQRMRAGDVVGVYRVFADAVQWIGMEGGTLIEIGCGGGHYHEVLDHLVRKPIGYIGVDYSAPLLRVARSRCPGAVFVQASAAHLPFAAKAVDVVVSGCVLLHMADYETAIRESARIARKWVIFHRTPVVMGPTVCFTKLAYGVKCVEVAFGHDDLRRLFADSGLAVMKAFDIGRYRVPTTRYEGRGITYVCSVN